MSAKETQEKKCERCLADGLNDDEDCEFYGEPDGCNSPEYGHYPISHFRNMSKMREALEKCVDLILRFGNAELDETPLEVIIDIEAILKAALSAPPRNCDVGTAEEQANRYANHCDTYLSEDGGNPCTCCPCCGKIPFGKCEFAWAQMPYTEREANG